MASRKGVIALMGSGELTATMVEVHKELLARLVSPARAAFLDTPAGFQLNADQLSQKAMAYFRDRVQQSMVVASFKGKEGTQPSEAEQVFLTLREANYVLIGPGSPTYAVRNWRGTLIPEILTKMVEKGGCLVAASAAALTVGCATLPVYEIYKVGEDPHWVEGINVLEAFGFNLVVVPHWNNAEGGTHDTRFCYMGQARFKKLESLLPKDVAILGLDEHTACLVDLEAREAVVKGIGRVTVRRQGAEISFAKGERFPLDLLRHGGNEQDWGGSSPQPGSVDMPGGSREGESFWDRIHALEAAFQSGLEGRRARTMTGALLDLDLLIWEAHRDQESMEFISQAREILREMIVLLGVELSSAPLDRTSCLNPLVMEMIELRKRFRQEKKWSEADAVRESLHRANIIVEDTRDGPLWRPGS
jgi:peptidase E